MTRVKPIGTKPSILQVISQFLITLGVTVTSMIIFFFLSDLICRGFIGSSAAELIKISPPYSPNEILGLKIIQVLSTSIGLFLVPALLIPLFFNINPIRFLNISNTSRLKFYLLAILLFIAMMPLLNWLIEWNQSLDLPHFLAPLEKMMRASEENLEEKTEVFLKMNNLSGFFFNLIIICIIPAIAEEFYFRGLVQRLFYSWFGGNVHVAVIITAIFFSAFHMQFFGFFPRLLLGIILGYLLYFSGSIWVPIFFHFINNSIVVVTSYLTQKGISDIDMSGTTSYPYFYTIISLGLTALIFFMISRSHSRKIKKTGQKVSDWAKVYTTNQLHTAQIIAGLLDNEGIPNVIMNKKDSAYQVFGEVELYVKPEDLEAAKEIIQNQDI